ncbi:MAG: hypothetical protein CHACPFDD_03776 [Phycisphaerae bacterium]|nr:hypothetical protein [Phycisphaerae bacterium]
MALLLATNIASVLTCSTTLCLSTAFAGFHVYALAAGTVVPCGCAGILITHASSGVHALLAAVSTAMAIGSTALLFSSSTDFARPKLWRDASGLVGDNGSTRS